MAGETTEETAVIIVITRNKRPNGQFIVYCSAIIPDDCPQDLLEIIATWDASRAYDDAARRAAGELMKKRRSARNGHSTAPA